MPFKASSAASPCTSAMSSVPASSSGTFSALPLVFCGLTSSVGSMALTVAATASPYTGKPPPGVAVPSDTAVLPDAPAANASGSIASIMPRLESTTQRIGAPSRFPQAWCCRPALSIFEPPAPGHSRTRAHARQIVSSIFAAARLRRPRDCRPAIGHAAAQGGTAAAAPSEDAARADSADRQPLRRLKAVKAQEDGDEIVAQIWKLWQQSGSPELDAAMQHAVLVMGQVPALALPVLDDIVARAPNWAEAGTSAPPCSI
jgi:hypothetical protein